MDKAVESFEAELKTRDRILHTAIGLFAKHGFEGCSVKMICDQAGVNISSVSYHFGGKDQLYQECLRQFGKARLEITLRILSIGDLQAHSSSPTRIGYFTRLDLFVEEMIRCQFEETNLVLMIHRELESDMSRSLDVFKKTFHKVFEAFVRFIEIGITHRFLPRQNAQVTTLLIFGAINNTLRIQSPLLRDLSTDLSFHATRDRLVRETQEFCRRAVGG